MADVDLPDVTQAVMLQAVKSFPRYDAQLGRPHRWLHRIALHTALHHKERAQHRYEVLQADSSSHVIDERLSADELAALKEGVELLGVIVGALPRQLASVLIEHDGNGIPMVQIASARGIPLSTAYKWRYRALREARKLALAERRGPPTPRSPGSPLTAASR